MNCPEGAKLIPLGKSGEYAIVDAWNYERVNKYRWFAKKNGNSYYAYRNIYLGGGRKNPKATMVSMHRYILNTPNGKETDHCNGNGLDNREDNLRICTTAQNQHNQISVRGMSKYKGVSWNKNAKKWDARIKLNNKPIRLGYYISEIEAAHAYDKAALKYYEKYAHTNFPKENYL